MQLFKYFFASSACVTLRREFLSCQFQCLLRTSMKIELIIAKSAYFTSPVNTQEMTICPLHRERFGIGWRRSIIQCSAPEELPGHDDTAKQRAERCCTLLQSKLILQATEKIRSSWFMLYVLNIIVRYSLMYVGTKDRQFLTFIHSFIHSTDDYFKPIIQTLLHSFFIRMLFFRPRLNIFIFCRF